MGKDRKFNLEPKLADVSSGRLDRALEHLGITDLVDPALREFIRNPGEQIFHTDENDYISDMTPIAVTAPEQMAVAKYPFIKFADKQTIGVARIDAIYDAGLIYAKRRSWAFKSTCTNTIWLRTWFYNGWTSIFSVCRA